MKENELVRIVAGIFEQSVNFLEIAFSMIWAGFGFGCGYAVAKLLFSLIKGA